jgi:hypothetical protein
LSVGYGEYVAKRHRERRTPNQNIQPTEQLFTPLAKWTVRKVEEKRQPAARQAAPRLMQTVRQTYYRSGRSQL